MLDRRTSYLRVAASDTSSEPTVREASVTGEKNQNLSNARKSSFAGISTRNTLNFKGFQILLQGARRWAIPRRNSRKMNITGAPVNGETATQTHPRSYKAGWCRREGSLNQEIFQPGQQVSVDHFMQHTQGRLYVGQSRGWEMYMGGCIFVDRQCRHVQLNIKVGLQFSRDPQARESFEQITLEMGAQVQSR
jgi:hypothetical protein